LIKLFLIIIEIKEIRCKFAKLTNPGSLDELKPILTCLCLLIDTISATASSGHRLRPAIFFFDIGLEHDLARTFDHAVSRCRSHMPAVLW
jgi:hypothetical protein